MSSPMAIGAVSAVICNLLDDGLVEAGGGAGGPVLISSIAPDLIDLADPAAQPRLNLFLYRVSPNQGWWNAELPSRGSDGQLISSPPLSINLHYLLTAYGQTNFQAEILLGYAMHLLHERPVLDRATLQRALTPDPLGASILPPGFAALSPADLANQAETITITLEPFDTEEIAKLWTAIQANYRPTAGYVVSAVLIQTKKPQRSALPVLHRGHVDPITGRDRGPVVSPSLDPPYPTLTSATPPPGQSAVRLGEAVDFNGTHLAGTDLVVSFTHRLLTIPLTIDVGVSKNSSTTTTTLPADAAAEAAWLPGMYSVTVSLLAADDSEPRTTDAVMMPLAPALTLPPASISRDAITGEISLTVQVSPQVEPAQDVWLFLGGIGAPAQPRATRTDTLSFLLPPVTAGAQWVRLRIDGVDSQLVNLTPPGSFNASQTVTVP
jgi:hypothetical protein